MGRTITPQGTESKHIIDTAFCCTETSPGLVDAPFDELLPNLGPHTVLRVREKPSSQRQRSQVDCGVLTECGKKIVAILHRDRYAFF